MPVPPHPWPLPPEDRTTSPYTGWTRAHWEAAADGLLAAVDPYTSPARGLITLPGAHSSSGRRSDGLEGYARTFLLAAFRVAGAGGRDPYGVLDRYADGLAVGTRTPGRDDAESWPRQADCGQAWVESASVALALRLTRPWLWDRLDDAVRQRAADWLSGALGEPPVDNNWWLFPLTVGGFLADAGVRTEASRAAVERGLERIEEWYAGDGWYTDGPERSFDHYNGWALHLYPVLHARLAGDRDLLERYGARLRAFLAGYARLFGGDGAPLHQGRSLTYRFAATAALWAGALTGHTPLPTGATRRIASGSLRYFLDRGAAAGHTTDRAGDGVPDARASRPVAPDAPPGLLSLGWHGPYAPIVQDYSGTASPYWASKGFVGLLLPPDHAEWTAPERPAPSEAADAVTPLPAPGWLVQSTAADGLVRVHNHGSHGQVFPPSRDDPLYARLAYSTRTGPTVPGEDPDNHFGLLAEDADGEHWLTRRGRITPLGSGPGWAASAHRPLVGDAELPGVTVTAVTLARGAAEVRIHRVRGAAPGTDVRISGWAVDGRATVAAAATAPAPAAPRPAVQDPATAREPAAREPAAREPAAREPASAQVPALHEPDVVSELVPVHGYGGVAESIAAGSTAYTREAWMPVLTGTVDDSGHGLFVCLARLSGDATAEPLAAALRVGDDEVRIAWPDGGPHQRVAFTRDAVTVADVVA
ncbi:DUF2264 domain-containing protein [Streptomyces sp. NPDC047108]|uniref:DUF2264 domain-containing protein n=1 Tax=Streptomyces sp. NPDC047108 TaxID=3155025 RepID=UPI0033F91FFB